MTLATSRKLAYVLCPFFLFVDVWRRFGRWHEWPAIMDDVIAGALLALALIKLRRQGRDGRVYLVAAWAYGVGMMYGSFFGQLMELNRPDASGLSTHFVVGVKAVLLGLCAIGLVGAVRGRVVADDTGHAS